MAHTDALLPMTSVDDIVYNTFVALDVTTSDRGGLIRNIQLVGTFAGWQQSRPDLPRDILVLSLSDNAGVLFVPKWSVQRAYWAPMGYRPKP